MPGGFLQHHVILLLFLLHELFNHSEFRGALAIKPSIGQTDPHAWVEKKLFHRLLHDYDTNSRPVVDGLTKTVSFNSSDNHLMNVQQVTVEHGLSLIQILDLNEMDQVLTTSVRSLMRWTDHHLIWDPAEFDNITSIIIPTHRLWLPDVALYNYADERLQEKRDCNLVVTHEGMVEWNPMAIFKSTCSVQIKKFPFDKQACKMKFGIWSFDGFRVNLTMYGNYYNFELSNYKESPEWERLHSTANFTDSHYNCCPEPYPDITYYLWIQRRAAFYNYILILPCFLLSSLTLVLFWLPPETPAKMVLGMNIFVAFFLLLLLLEDSIPSASSQFPILGTYFCLSMIIITLSSFLCLIVVNFHFRGDSRMEVPLWLKKLTLQYGAKYLWVNVGNVNVKKPEPVKPPSQDPRGQLPPNSVQFFRQQHQQSQLAQRGAAPGWPQQTLQGPNKPKPVGAVPQQQQRTLLFNEFGESAIFSGPWVSEPPNPAVTMRNSYEQRMHGMPLEMQQLPPRYAHQVLPGRGAELATSGYTPSNVGAQQNCIVHETFPSNSVSNRTKQAHFHESAAMQQQQRPRVSHLGGPTTTTTDDDEDDNVEDVPKGAAKFEDVLMEVIRGGHDGLLQSSTPQRKSSRGNNYTNSAYTSNAVVPNFSTSRRIHMITKDVNDIVKCLRTIQKINENKEKVNRVVGEWRSVGMVLDRIFFVIYLITITLTSTLFFTDDSDDVIVGDTHTVK